MKHETKILISIVVLVFMYFFFSMTLSNENPISSEHAVSTYEENYLDETLGALGR